MISLIFSMFTFSLSMSISPGPVNLTILGIGMNYGTRKTFAFTLGATVGFTLLLAAVCFGLYHVILLYSGILNLITLLGTLLLIWIGLNILKSEGHTITTADVDQTKVPTFIQGFLMQWLNPKAWIAAVAGTALFSATQNPLHLMLFVLIYFVVCFISLMIWGIAGEKLARFLNTRYRAKLFNVAMGCLLIGISLQLCWQHFA